MELMNEVQEESMPQIQPEAEERQVDEENNSEEEQTDAGRQGVEEPEWMKQPLYFRIKDFFAGNRGLTLSIACLALLGVLFGTKLLSRSSASGLQVGIAVVIAVYCGLNMLLRCLRKKTFKPISEPFKKVFAFMLALVAFYAFFLRNETRDANSIICLVILLVLCLLSYKFTIVNKDRWNIPDEPLKKLVELKYIGITIAIMQIFVAVPSMEDALRSIKIRSDLEKMQDVVAQGRESLQKVKIVEIPDSLQNGVIKDMRLLQNKLFALANIYGKIDPGKYILNDKQKNLKADSIQAILVRNMEEFIKLNTLVGETNVLIENAIMPMVVDDLNENGGAGIASLIKLWEYLPVYTSFDLLQETVDLKEEYNQELSKIAENVTKITNDVDYSKMKENRKKKTILKVAKEVENCYASENIRKIIGKTFEEAAGYIEFLNFAQMALAYGLEY